MSEDVLQHRVEEIEKDVKELQDRFKNGISETLAVHQVKLQDLHEEGIDQERCNQEFREKFVRIYNDLTDRIAAVQIEMKEVSTRQSVIWGIVYLIITICVSAALGLLFNK